MFLLYNTDKKDNAFTLKLWQAFLFYLILTLIFTYPVIFHLNTKIIGATDGFFFLWDIWWFKYAIFTLHTNPLVNNTIYYPLHNVPMVWSTPINELTAIPLQFLFGDLITYNLLILLHFILAGLFAFIFLQKIIKSDLPAFIGGVVYTFSTYHFITVGIGTLGLATIEFIPLYLYYFIDFINSPCLKNFALMTVFAILVALSDPYIAIYFLFIFAVVFIIYTLIFNRGLLFKRKAFLGLFLSSTVTVIIASAFYMPMVHTVSALKSAKIMSNDAIIYSEDVLGYFLPSKINFLWHRFFYNKKLNITADHYFIGYITMIIVIAGIIKSKLEYKGLYLLFLTVAFALSLGPYLQFNGPVTFNIHSQPHLIPMPYYLIWKAPILRFLRYPGRIALDVTLMLAIFVSAFLSTVMKKDALTIIVTIALSIVIPLETEPFFPFLTTDATIPSIYKIIKDEKAIKAIYELPSGSELYHKYDLSSYKYMYYQTYHHKSIVYGHTPRPPDNGDDFTLLNPLFQVFSEPEVLVYGDIIDIKPDLYIPYGIQALHVHNIQPILLHKDFVLSVFKNNKDIEDALYKLLKTAFGNPVIDDNNIAMFMVPTNYKATFEPIIYLGKGWYPPGWYTNGIAYRWMQDDGEIRLANWKAGYFNIEFSIFRPFDQIKVLDVYLNKTFLAQLNITSITSPNIGKITIPHVFIPHGENKIMIHSEEGAYEPFFTQTGFQDVNKYSVAISLVTVTPYNTRNH